MHIVANCSICYYFKYPWQHSCFIEFDSSLYVCSYIQLYSYRCYPMNIRELEIQEKDITIHVTCRRVTCMQGLHKFKCHSQLHIYSSQLASYVLNKLSCIYISINIAGQLYHPKEIESMLQWHNHADLLSFRAQSGVRVCDSQQIQNVLL